MATKSNRSKDNITKNIFIKTLLFCILLSLCLYQVIYFLASNYDKERFAKENGAQTTEHADSDKQNDQSKTNQNKAVPESNTFNFQSSIIDYKTLSTAINHLLQPSQTAKTKEHAQNIAGKNSTAAPLTEAEKQIANNDALHKQNAANKTNDNPRLADALQQLAPHIGATMLALSLLGSLIYAKIIAKPFRYMSDALKDIMNLDFSDKKLLNKNTDQTDFNLQVAASQVPTIVKNLHESNQDLRNELKKEQQLEQSRKEFMSMVSHELKTPIAAVMGQLDGMIHGIGAYKDRDKYLKRSYEMMQDINILTEKMSELSKIQNPQFKPNLEVISLTTIIEDVMKKVDYFVSVKQLNVQSNIKQDVQILADPKFIQTAIFNIISNAIHYTIDHQHVYIKLYEKPNGYALEVLNTGSQIDEDKLAHLFEPFYRANPDKHGLVQGSGLGLYIVKQILDKHQFPYGIQNTPQGVKCSIVFPKAM
ncbi:sensor histidine kinase [Bacillus mycoides]|uniref:sensor histidine kinase n=1 Tax=Bacillus mycoides TaxID=1405 RepID=UPI0010387E4B|nr:HAMP domain-containing sensor histidine kinase [Bacillus mycoides]MBJ7995205.1 HAMP domain-containing histidine kinase [Bacillus cereus]MED1402471.1 HAMP domain-containing sensor histidine kinase [Bacillus mycoides]QWH83094.1 HAMP domain-containing histidine kinase [Bacillus mycoides]QWI95110.1 HAMP domain-containing histidine kinase [Bacillus mycoides]TBX54344.1 HAMP domain-containing histidine kinase [Bacillus mycoides]